MNIEIPLISEDSRKHYDSASDKSEKLHHRAIDLRICLEEICDSIIINFIDENTKSKWHARNFVLDKKLKSAKIFLGDQVVEDLLRIKETGNEGAHKGLKGAISSEVIEEYLEIIKKFSLQVFISYFAKYPIKHVPGGSWDVFVLSTLPPIYRVYILKEHFKINKSLFVIDKLSMAIMKNGEFLQSLDFVNSCLSEGIISRDEAHQQKEKLEILNNSFEKLPIAQSLKDSKKTFNSVLQEIPDVERDAFIYLMSAILLDSDNIIIS